MATCKIEERDAGRAYPRTCPTCKLGPCRKGHSKALAPTPKENPMTQNDEGNMLAPMWLFDHVAACIRKGDATEQMAQNVEYLRAIMGTQTARIAELEALVAADFDMLDSTWKARAEAAEAEVARLREAALMVKDMIQDNPQYAVALDVLQSALNPKEGL